jgi:hypothetical protein
MMKVFVALLALATALAITPAALADTFYTLTANGTEAGNAQPISVTANLDLSSLGGGVYQVVGATGSVLDAFGNTDTITGVATGWVNPFSYDNLVTIPAAYSGLNTGLAHFDDLGVLFTTNSPGFDFIIGINEYYNDGNYQYGDNGLGGSVNYPIANNWPYDTTDLTVSLTPTPTPEPSSLLLLGTGLLGLAFVAFRKAKSSGLIFHS